MSVEAKQKSDSSDTIDTSTNDSVLSPITMQNTNEDMPDKINQRLNDSGKSKVDTASIHDERAMELNTEANPTTDIARTETEPGPRNPNIDQNEQNNIRRSQRIKEKQGKKLDLDIIGDNDDPNDPDYL